MNVLTLVRPFACALAVLFVGSTGVVAQEDVGPAGPMVPYSQDFESIDLGIVSDEKFSNLWEDDNWRVFGNAFSSDGANYLYGYGPFFAPNNLDGGGVGPGFSLVSDAVETTSGTRYLNVFSDYNNGQHRDGSGTLINALVYQDREVTSDLVGQTWTFEFDYRNADGGFGVADDTSGVSTANAFVKVLDSMSGSFAEINGARLDTSDATNTFTPGSIDFEITSDHVGQLLQFGFENFASNDSPSGVFYDTLSFAPAGAAVLGDFNGDGNVDLLDLDQYNGNIGSAPTGALADLDLDGDDDIDADDFAQHYEQLVETSNGQTGTFAGDTNLDGIVDVLVDAAKVVDNLGGTVASWANGDFNGDGTVDVLNDAAALVNNLGSDNTPTTAGVSASAVPEPSSISLLAAAVVGLAARRRR